MRQGILTAKELAIGYNQGGRDEKVIQHNLNFTLEPGTLTCILGPNGAGKSTLLRTLGGMQPALSGELLLSARPLTSYSEQAKSQTIGLVLTDKIFAGGLRVAELVSLGRHPHSGFFGRLDQEDRKQIELAMIQVGIEEKADSYISEISDGERQKVMIAKALAQECPLILLDEPTAFLDVASRIEIMHLLHNLAEQGKTILLSTHDIEQALLLADQLWLLARGKGMICNTTEDLVLQGEMDRLFRRGNISFDPLRGSFRMNGDHLPGIRVEAQGELMLWTQNALRRNGFQTLAATAQTEINCDTPNDPNAETPQTLDRIDTGWSISVRTSDRIEVRSPAGICTPCTCFKELISVIKNIKR